MDRPPLAFQTFLILVTHGPFCFTGSTYPTAYPNEGNTFSRLERNGILKVTTPLCSPRPPHLK